MFANPFLGARAKKAQNLLFASGQHDSGKSKTQKNKKPLVMVLRPLKRYFIDSRVIQANVITTRFGLQKLLLGALRMPLRKIQHGDGSGRFEAGVSLPSVEKRAVVLQQPWHRYVVLVRITSVITRSAHGDPLGVKVKIAPPRFRNDTGFIDMCLGEALIKRCRGLGGNAFAIKSATVEIMITVVGKRVRVIACMGEKWHVEPFRQQARPMPMAVTHIEGTEIFGGVDVRTVF